MTPHSSTLAWQIPWAEEPGRLQSMGSLRVGLDWATSLSLLTFMHWRRKWQPTPVFLPGESQGRGSLAGCRLWGHTESDTTEVTQQQQQQYSYLHKFLDPHICEIIQYMSFFVSHISLNIMPSRFMCVVTSGKISFFYMAEYFIDCIPHHLYPSICRWTPWLFLYVSYCK